MRILIASHHVEIVGGAETYLRAVIREFIRLGHSIGILCNDEYSNRTNSVTEDFPDLPIWRTANCSSVNLFREIKGWQPDVVYAHSAFPEELEDLLFDSYPIVLFAHNYFGTCISGTKCHSRRQWRPCDRTLGVGCLGCYLPLGCGGNNPLTMWKLFREQTRRRNTLHRYAAVAVASRHMKQEFLNHGLEQRSVHVVPLFPPDIAALADPPQPRRQGNRLLFLGRLTPLKGVPHLFAAVPEAARILNRPLHLHVGGDGPERMRLQSMARKYDFPTTFLGWLNTQQTREQILAADLLVVPSLWPEPLGLVGLEAGSLGLPTAGYIRGGISEWLIPGQTGEGSAEPSPCSSELAASIVRALVDDTHWNQLRLGAWNFARSFTVEHHLNKLMPLLEGACRKTPSDAG